MMEKINKVVGAVDKLAESPALTYIVGGLKSLGGDIEEGLNEAVAAKRRAAEAKPLGIGGSTAGLGVTDIDVLKNSSEEERAALASMSPEGKKRYIAAKMLSAKEAEKKNFLSAAEGFAKSGERYAETLEGIETSKEALQKDMTKMADANAAKNAAALKSLSSKNALSDMNREFPTLRGASAEEKLSSLRSNLQMTADELKMLDATNPKNNERISQLRRTLELGGQVAQKLREYNDRIKMGSYPISAEQQAEFDKGIATSKAVADAAIKMGEEGTKEAISKLAADEMRAGGVDTNLPPSPPQFVVPVTAPSVSTPVVTTPSVDAVVAAPVVAAPVVAAPPTPFYPESKVGESDIPTFASAEDLTKRVMAETDPIKRKALIDEIAHQAIAVAAASGTVAAPATAATPYTPVQQTPIRKELSKEAKFVDIEDVDVDAQRLASQYGLDAEAVKRMRMLQEMGIDVQPGGELTSTLRSTEQISAAARLADTPEKQRLILEAAKNVTLKPKNVFEALGFGDDPERKIAFARTVSELFPKKTAQDTYWEIQNKAEKAKQLAEKTKTEREKRAGEVAKGEATVAKTDASTALTQEQARGVAAKTRTEDFLRSAKLSEKIAAMAAEAKRAEAALVAARRPRARGGLTFAQMLALQDAKAGASAAKGYYDNAAKLEGEAVKHDADATANTVDPKVKASIEKRAASTIRTASAMKDRGDAQKQLAIINIKEAKAAASKTAATNARAAAKISKELGDKEVLKTTEIMQKASAVPSTPTLPAAK